MVRRRRPAPLASSEHYRVKAVEQTLQILDVLAESPDLALPEIAERIGLATPNAHKLILHLQEAGLVERPASSTSAIASAPAASPS